MTEKKTALNPRHWLVLTVLLFAPVCAVQAARGNAGDKYSLNITMSGTVVANGSCKFDTGELTVDFNDVKLKGTGSNTVALEGDYTQPLTSHFSCTGDTAGLLQMKFTSASGSYETYNGSQVLGTDKGIVAIQLLVNGAAQTMNEWFTIDQKAPPTLQAKLVQVSTTNSSNVVSGDLFTASGTLTLAFN